MPSCAQKTRAARRGSKTQERQRATRDRLACTTSGGRRRGSLEAGLRVRGHGATGSSCAVLQAGELRRALERLPVLELQPEHRSPPSRASQVPYRGVPGGRARLPGSRPRSAPLGLRPGPPAFAAHTGEPPPRMTRPRSTGTVCGWSRPEACSSTRAGPTGGRFRAEGRRRPRSPPSDLPHSPTPISSTAPLGFSM